MFSIFKTEPPLPPSKRREQNRKTHRGNGVKHTDVLRKLLFRDICLCARLEKVKLLSTSSPKWGGVGPERKWAVKKPAIRTLRVEKHSFLDEVPHLWATSRPKCFALSNVCYSDEEDSSCPHVSGPLTEALAAGPLSSSQCWPISVSER